MYTVTEKDLIGDLDGFPIEVVQKMIEYQIKQSGFHGVSGFQKDRFSYVNGFNWSHTSERSEFWYDVIVYKNFDIFFEKYPKHKTRRATAKELYEKGYLAHIDIHNISTNRKTVFNNKHKVVLSKLF